MYWSVFFSPECGISRFDRHSFVYRLGCFLGSYFFFPGLVSFVVVSLVLGVG